VSLSYDPAAAFVSGAAKSSRLISSLWTGKLSVQNLAHIKSASCLKFQEEALQISSSLGLLLRRAFHDEGIQFIHRYNRQFDRRWMRFVMKKYSLQTLACVQISIIARKVGAGDIDPDPMSLLEDPCRWPDRDLPGVDFSRFEILDF
jgi:hypothetical protein